MPNRALALTVLLLVSAGVAGCKSFEPVAASECKKVVTHARKLLGKKADKRSKMMKDCKAASDQERGCAQNANSAADLLRCSM